jgi:hypothetical protein
LTEIDWAKECSNSGRFEDLAALLLVRMYPGAERIDGSGGDGGRDVQLRSCDQLTIWEMKAFADRLGKSKTRKPQIMKSLRRAAKLTPTAWHLVAPMTPNPGELAWYDKLRDTYPFVAEWRDRGTSGVEVTGWDAARTAELTVRVDETTGESTVKVVGNEDTGPILP